MSDDLRPGPDSPPTDELDGAEATFAVLNHVLHGIADVDLEKQTPCREFDRTDSVERQVIPAGRPALDAWKRRGRDGTVSFGMSFGTNEVQAKVIVGILSLEFLVHAWDYAAAIGREVNAPDSLSDYVLGLARNIITPQGRAKAGFDDPIDVPTDAGVLDRLIAYTGRAPGLNG
ncbi:TIGR03086 family protein [Mycolicibacterium moriokaense]|uniref:TIGR03086 family protein n=1 Tax=Mycolicibacterium moriokaense TaxID=39691 RepID=A0AAD1H7W9_9MYCO|nr:TIGR03086 family metal-binding protein [Mycolicibacterium moriokaense]MCV7038978.1 TIGR03086 family protein [Mycolicibacterium moriokaense]ORB20422.1 TIGR03086 family protein [Mycolicibacterium moriokaense]BBW99875.1 TIGR03086 family protein [Mycolicibacterium moriokaense]